MTSIEAEIKLADDNRQFALKYIENHWKDESDDKKFGFEMGILIGYNKAKSTLYTEEEIIGFAEWLLNSDSKKVLTRTKESLLKEYIETLK